MATGFGFSVGDFVAGIQLVRDVINALSDARGASAEYRALITELYGLERCLIEVKDLKLDGSQEAQLTAIRAAACQCQKTIDGFGKKLQKYQPHLRSGGSGSIVGDAWKKVRWSLCEKNDIARFKADISGHTGSLSVLLMTVQMKATSITGHKHGEQSNTIARRLQEASFSVLGALQRIAKNVTNLMDSTATVLRTNLQIFQMVLEMHNIITRIPGQVDRGKPVYFLDALGREAPFFLEFIPTKEAFLAVLKERFKNNGAKKIEREEFVLEVRGQKRAINMQKTWETWFSPGQRVDMSMLFLNFPSTGSTCPACQFDCDCPTDANTECSNCGTVFRRVTDAEDFKAAPTSTHNDEANHDSFPANLDAALFGPSRPTPSLKRKREVDEVEDIDVRRFRRVRILERLLPDLDGCNDFYEGAKLLMLLLLEKLRTLFGETYWYLESENTLFSYTFWKLEQCQYFSKLEFCNDVDIHWLVLRGQCDNDADNQIFWERTEILRKETARLISLLPAPYLKSGEGTSNQSAPEYEIALEYEMSGKYRYTLAQTPAPEIIAHSSSSEIGESRSSSILKELTPSSPRRKKVRRRSSRYKRREPVGLFRDFAPLDPDFVEGVGSRTYILPSSSSEESESKEE